MREEDRSDETEDGLRFLRSTIDLLFDSSVRPSGYKLRLHYIYTSQDDKITMLSVAVRRIRRIRAQVLVIFQGTDRRNW